MVKLTIDNKVVEVPEGTTILEAARKAQLRIPTLCYLECINEIGACRVCVVELKGSQKLATSNTHRRSLDVSTRVRHARRMAVEPC